jgi:hypothetical protein
MVTRPIPLTKAQADELAVVCAKGRERLHRLASTLEERGVIISPTRLKAIVAEEVRDDSGVVTRQLMTWASFGTRNYVPSSEIVSGLTAGLRSLSAWEEATWSRWEECKADLQRLLDALPVRLSAKALDLSFEFTNYCISAQIITDARPVFDDRSLAGDDEFAVVGAVISQTLRLEYATREGRHSISVALDREDLEKLQRACKRALQKGDKMITLARDEWKLEAFAVGEENYGIL